MSQFTIGSLALELTGGAGPVGSVTSQIGRTAGITAALTTKILDVIMAAIRRIVGFIKEQIRAIFRDRERLAAFDPTVAMARSTAMIREVLRDITRAQVLGPGILELTLNVERLKDTIAPLVTLIKGRLIDSINRLIFGPSPLFKDALGGEVSIADSIGRTADFLQRLLPKIFDGSGFKGLANLEQKLLEASEKVVEEIKELNKTLGKGNDVNELGRLNGIFADDLRLLTEGGSLHGFTTDPKGTRVPTRIPIGTGGRDLFSPI